MSYIKNSKTSEAKTNLDSIKKGAISFFEAEHYSENGMTAASKQYPGSIEAAKLGVEPTDKTVGVKQSPVTDAIKSEFTNVPWSELNFRLTSPFYYSYAYIADGQETKEVGTGTEADPKHLVYVEGSYKQSHFQATACASLNAEKDSVFYINGYSDGSASPVIEGTTTQCYTATVPADPS